MSMATIGDSLDQKKTLESLSRPWMKSWSGDMCVKCRTNAHPRGFNPHTRLCWWCQFPGVGK
jgi:hypothetical protein